VSSTAASQSGCSGFKVRLVHEYSTIFFLWFYSFSPAALSFTVVATVYVPVSRLLTSMQTFDAV